MVRIFLLIVLLFWLILAPASTSLASERKSDIDSLLLQLNAIRSFLSRTHETEIGKPLSSEELRGSIRSGVTWLKNAQEESGHFRYEYQPYEGTYRDDDNIVRQAGSFYALGEVAQKTKGDTYWVQDAMKKAISYLHSNTREDSYGGTDIACVANSPTSKRCQLGTTALTLVGLLAYQEAFPKEARAYAPLIRKYSAFILEMQKPNGGFRNLYTIGSAKQLDDESPFSNGEAMLALVRMYRHTPVAATKAAIDRSFTYLRKEPYDANLYLWIMTALKDLDSLGQREEYIEYAQSFTQWRVERAKLFTNRTQNYCAYAEGLASALSVLKNTTSNSDTFRSELDRFNRNHHALQLTSNDRYRIVNDGEKLALKSLSSPELALGGFLTSDTKPTQRIDFTQHCLGSFMGTLDLDEEKL